MVMVNKGSTARKQMRAKALTQPDLRPSVLLVYGQLDLMVSKGWSGLRTGLLKPTILNADTNP